MSGRCCGRVQEIMGHALGWGRGQRCVARAVGEPNLAISCSVCHLRTKLAPAGVPTGSGITDPLHWRQRALAGRVAGAGQSLRQP